MTVGQIICDAVDRNGWTLKTALTVLVEFMEERGGLEGELVEYIERRESEETEQ